MSKTSWRSIRFGNAQFRYYGDGREYFVLNILGDLFTILALGIYSFWRQKSLFDCCIICLSIENGELKTQFKSKATGMGFMNLTNVRLLIIIFHLGLQFLGLL